MKKFYMVFLEGGHNPTFKHDTIDNAEKEAKRLAKLYNKKAYVLCTIKSFEINEYIIEDLRDDNSIPF